MKIKAIAIFACVCLTVFAQPTIWNGTADVSWYNDGDTVFYISTAEQLAGLSQLVGKGNEFKDKTIKLTQDIYLNDTSGWKNWDKYPPRNEWRQIGFLISGGWWFRIEPFMGKFEGDGHFIYGMYIYYRRYPLWVICPKGLFGWTKNAIINNVGLSHFYIYSNNYYLATITGINTNSIIENCAISGVINGNKFVGGISGATTEQGKIISNSVYAEITGDEFVGGISGFVKNSNVSENNFNGNVLGYSRSVGVLAGGAFGKSVIVNNEFSNKNNAKIVGKSKRKTIVENNNIRR